MATPVEQSSTKDGSQRSVEEHMDNVIHIFNDIAALLAKPTLVEQPDNPDDMSCYYPTTILQEFREKCTSCCEAAKQAVKAREDWAKQVDKEYEDAVNKFSGIQANISSTNNKIKTQRTSVDARQKAVSQVQSDTRSVEREAQKAQAEWDKSKKEYDDAMYTLQPPQTGNLWHDLWQALGSGPLETPADGQMMQQAKMQRAIAAEAKFKAAEDNKKSWREKSNALQSNLEVEQKELSQLKQDAKKYANTASMLAADKQALEEQQQRLIHAKDTCHEMLELVNKVFANASSLGSFLSVKILTSSASRFVKAIESGKGFSRPLERLDATGYEAIASTIRTLQPSIAPASEGV